MAQSAKRRWRMGTLAVPFLLSLAVHGMLFGVLWFWPVRSPGPALSIESTRISLDTCVLDAGPAAKQSERELPEYLRGPNIGIEMQPQLLEAPATSSEPPAASGPTLSADESVHPRTPSAAGRGGGTGAEGAGVSGSLFPLPATASSVVYVLDRSVSMGIDRKLDFARWELIASLRRLPPSVRFQVIDYNDYAKTLVVDGQRDLLPAEPAIVAKAVAQLQALDAAGNTSHLAALRLGIALHPDVLYFLTDADDLKPEDVATITRLNQRTIVYAIELTRRHASRPDSPLAQLARDNRGTYRRVWISSPD